MRAKIRFLIAPLLLLLVLLALFWQRDFSVSAAKDILSLLVKEGAPLALVALGMGLVIAAGEIDLSVAGTATLCGILYAALCQSGLPLFPAAALSVCAGAGLGALLGLAIVSFHASSLILSWAFGVIWIICGIVFAGMNIVQSSPSSVALPVLPPPEFWWFGGQGFSLALALISIICTALWLSRFPQFACALGGSRKSALYSGVALRRVLLGAYALSGALAALAGICWCLISGTAVTIDHLGKELSIIAIAVFGGTALQGGYLALSAVTAAAIFWAATKLLVDSMDFSFIGNFQHHAANAVFALIFILMLAVFGKRLSGVTKTYLFSQETS